MRADIDTRDNDDDDIATTIDDDNRRHDDDSMLNGDAAAAKKRGCFPKRATNQLKHWLFQNLTVCRFFLHSLFWAV